MDICRGRFTFGWRLTGCLNPRTGQIRDIKGGGTYEDHHFKLTKELLVVYVWKADLCCNCWLIVW